MDEHNLLLVKEPEKAWGGPWTEIKLDAFENYVRAYLSIMRKHKYWKTIYFDGFAGSGSRKTKEVFDISFLNITREEKSVYRGAAERMVSMEAPFVFDYYYFIEKNQKSLDLLETRLQSTPKAENKKLVFRPGDCNGELLKLGSALRSKKYDALIFLDPFGMQVNWDSIAALSGTRSDIWILLPTAVIINRLLDRKGRLKATKSLQRFFGLPEKEIRDYFYKPTGQQTLFSEEPEEFRKILNPITKIAEIYISRLKTVWKYVPESPMRLDNSRGAPLFHFVFASNNDKALKIANYIIKRKV